IFPENRRGMAEARNMGFPATVLVLLEVPFHWSQRVRIQPIRLVSTKLWPVGCARGAGQHKGKKGAARKSHQWPPHPSPLPLGGGGGGLREWCSSSAVFSPSPSEGERAGVRGRRLCYGRTPVQAVQLSFRFSSSVTLSYSYTVTAAREAGSFALSRLIAASGESNFSSLLLRFLSLTVAWPFDPG